MNYRASVFLIGSCLIAIAMAVLVASSGAGLLMTFLAYSISGSTTLMLLSVVSYLCFDDEAEQDEGELLLASV